MKCDSMGFLEKILKHIAGLQKKYALPILLVVLFITIVIGLGIGNIRLETDMNKEMPQELPIYVLNDKITATFGGQDTIMVLIMLDNDQDTKDTPKDIRDPKIMQYLLDFEESLSTESSVSGVMSASTFFKGLPIDSIESIKSYEAMIPQLSNFFSRDYSSTFMLVTTDIGGSEKKIKEIVNLIDEKIDVLSSPAGTKTMVTGSAPVQNTIFTLLGQDAVFTLVLASVIILILLFILERSIFKGILIFTPLLLGLIWTMGTMGWLGIKISIATAGLGAMILGLGVEYGVFMYSRYEEERNKGKNQLESLQVAVPAVGSAVLGSGTTTIIGFLALTLSIMPMLQKLGISLALGIFYCIIAAVLVEPVIIILEEQMQQQITEKLKRTYEHKKKKARNIE